MTSDQDPNEAPRLTNGDLTLTIRSASDGSAFLALAWTAESPWVPDGSLMLSTNDPHILNMGYKGVVEGVIIQLRPILQGMLAQAWPPF